MLFQLMFLALGVAMLWKIYLAERWWERVTYVVMSIIFISLSAYLKLHSV